MRCVSVSMVVCIYDLIDRVNMSSLRAELQKDRKLEVLLPPPNLTHKLISSFCMSAKKMCVIISDETLIGWF